jgi:hypothetical protein
MGVIIKHFRPHQFQFPHSPKEHIMHPHAYHAIRAAQNRHIWGYWATLKFIQHRGVPHRLYTLAQVLENAKGVTS